MKFAVAFALLAIVGYASARTPWTIDRLFTPFDQEDLEAAHKELTEGGSAFLGMLGSLGKDAVTFYKDELSGKNARDRAEEEYKRDHMFDDLPEVIAEYEAKEIAKKEAEAAQPIAAAEPAPSAPSAPSA